MITNKPCCDNCPHYIVKEQGSVMRKRTGVCGWEAAHGTCDPTHRCGNHPWVARVTSEAVANYAASWREYIDDVPLLIDIMAGGGTGSPEVKPKRPDAEKLAFARGALTIVVLNKEKFDNAEDRTEELDAVIAMEEAACAAIKILDGEEGTP